MTALARPKTMAETMASRELIDLSCITCGEPFQRPRFQHESNLRRNRRGPYCSKACSNRASPRTPSRGVRLQDLLDRTQPNGECWEWTGARNRYGYGHIRERGVTRQVPRVVLELAYGVPVPAGMQALHSCDNPPCIRPAHLRIGTALENANDRRARGRDRWARA